MTENPFGADVIEAVAAHMNDDHAPDALLIVRAFGGVPEARAASVTHLDGDGVDFAVDLDGPVNGVAEPVAVRIPWSRPLTERPEIRREFVRLYEEAVIALGESPAPRHH